MYILVLDIYPTYSSFIERSIEALITSTRPCWWTFAIGGLNGDAFCHGSIMASWSSPHNLRDTILHRSRSPIWCNALTRAFLHFFSSLNRSHLLHQYFWPQVENSTSGTLQTAILMDGAFASTSVYCGSGTEKITAADQGLCYGCHKMCSWIFIRRSFFLQFQQLTVKSSWMDMVGSCVWIIRW